MENNIAKKFIEENKHKLGKGEDMELLTPIQQDKLMIQLEVLGLTHFITYKKLVQLNLERQDAIDINEYRKKVIQQNDYNTNYHKCLRCNEKKHKDNMKNKTCCLSCFKIACGGTLEPKIRKKHCNVCSKYKILTDFRPHKRGFSNTCKECVIPQKETKNRKLAKEYIDNRIKNNDPLTQVCNTCSIEKHLSEYHYCQKTRKLKKICKNCYSEKVIKYRKSLQK